jgi:hypothetical protein
MDPLLDEVEGKQCARSEHARTVAPVVETTMAELRRVFRADTRDAPLLAGDSDLIPSSLRDTTGRHDRTIAHGLDRLTRVRLLDSLVNLRNPRDPGTGTLNPGNPGNPGTM